MTDQYKGTDKNLRLHARKGHELEFFFVPSGGLRNPFTVKFMAFLTQMEDTYTSQWEKDMVYGRMDPIATFQGTVRTISLGWTVPAFSGAEAQNNLVKMSRLISMCYPVYGNQNTSVRGAGQISGAPLIKIKFANLITGMTGNNSGSDINGAAKNGLLGWIDGITFSPNLDAGFFDPGPGKLFPKQIDLACQFNVLHEHALGWTRSKLSKEDGDRSLSKTQKGALRRQTGDAFPYGLKFSTGAELAAEETPANSSKTIDENTSEVIDDINIISADSVVERATKAAELEILGRNDETGAVELGEMKI